MILIGLQLTTYTILLKMRETLWYVGISMIIITIMATTTVNAIDNGQCNRQGVNSDDDTVCSADGSPYDQ